MHCRVECAKNHHLRGVDLNVYGNQRLLAADCSYKRVDVWVCLFYEIYVLVEK